MSDPINFDAVTSIVKWMRENGVTRYKLDTDIEIEIDPYYPFGAPSKSWPWNTPVTYGPL